MKKFIWISLAALLVLGCGSRKRDLNKGSEKSKFQSSGSGKSTTDFSKTTFRENNLSELLEHQNLKISSNGAPYQVKYGNLIFSGNADLELSKNKMETKKVNRFYDYMVFHHTNIYQTHTQYNTETTYKSVKTERSGLSLVSVIWIMIAVYIAGAITWPLIKQYIPVLFRKIIKLKSKL